MEREILFKGKTIDGNRLIKGSLLWDCYNKKKRYYILPDSSVSFDDFEEVHPDTVCQQFNCGSGSFFEDDKVSYEGKEYVVKFNLSFATLERCMCDHGENITIPIDEDVAYLMKVIGNIHD